jgi:hypothetical protein
MYALRLEPVHVDGIWQGKVRDCFELGSEMSGKCRYLSIDPCWSQSEYMYAAVGAILSRIQ